MDIIKAYIVVNNSIKEILDDLVPISIIEEKVKPVQKRLTLNPFNVSVRSDRVSNVVVAHNLSQYMNKFYSISFRDKDVCYIDILTNLNREEVDISEFGGALCS